MAICSDCKQEMTEARTCTFGFIVEGDKWWPRDRYHFGELSGRCHDCAIQHGGVHHAGCDVERCPKCGGQLISCDCWGDELIVGRKDGKR